MLRQHCGKQVQRNELVYYHGDNTMLCYYVIMLGLDVCLKPGPQNVQEGVCPWKKDIDSFHKCFWNLCHMPDTVLGRESATAQLDSVPCPRGGHLLAHLKLEKLNTLNLVAAAKYNISKRTRRMAQSYSVKW